MHLILLDLPNTKRHQFYPLTLSRPVWELRCGMTSLGEKLVAKTRPQQVSCFVPPYMAEAYREQTQWSVNDTASLSADDLLIVNGRVKADHLDLKSIQAGEAVFDRTGELLFTHLSRSDLDNLNIASIDDLISSIKESKSIIERDVPTWNYTWELVLANAEQLKRDFVTARQHGIEGKIEEPSALRGARFDIYVAPGALVHPMVVIDAEHGPVYIDEGAEIHPFTRIEGPCYIGKNSILLGAKCREGTSIGPVCRVGGEIEEAIIHGHSNKYHDGFLGHAYVGEWDNLGAMTTNSDLKNDYSNVTVSLDGRNPIDTGSKKVGALIGDHTKTSIGTLFNTGAYVGAMAVIAATGKPLPKYIPSFAWFLEGVVTKGFGKRKLYETAQTVMSRRGCEWSAAQQSMWDEIFNITAPERAEAVKKGRRTLRSQNA